MDKVAGRVPQAFSPLVTVLGFVTILALSGMYPLPVLAQESGEPAVPSISGGGTDMNKSLSSETPAITEGGGADSQPVNETPAIAEGAGSQPANEAPAITKPSGPMSATDKLVTRFMGLDTDTSGGVSFEEYMTMVRERAVARYAAMDSNDDGEVTDEEYRTFWKSRMAQWYRLKR